MVIKPIHEQAIRYLLAGKKQKAVAKRLKVSDRVIRKWLQDRDFQAAYGEARHRLINAAMDQLQTVSGKAVATLAAHLEGSEPKPADKIRAALGILKYAIVATRMQDLAELGAEVERMKENVRNFLNKGSQQPAP